MVFCSKERALILESMSHSKVMHNTGNKADLLKSIILSIICPSKIWSKKIIAVCFLCNLFRKYFIYKQKLAVPGQLGYELKRKPFFFNVLLAHRKCFSFHCEGGLSAFILHGCFFPRFLSLLRPFFLCSCKLSIQTNFSVSTSLWKNTSLSQDHSGGE